MIEHSEDNDELTPNQREAVMQMELERLKQMTYYATSKRCLRAFILRYFGEESPQNCDNCSVCDEEPFEISNGKNARKISVRATPEERKARREERKLKRMGEENGFGSWERALLENLKTLRSLLASRKKVPAYTVFSDASLIDMVRKRPMTLDGFLDVSGVGQMKAHKYGGVFLDEIRRYLMKNE